jgi:hypothetical protein
MLRRRMRLRRIVFIINVQSNATKFLIPIAARYQHGRDSQETVQILSTRSVRTRDERVNSRHDGAHQNFVQDQIAGCILLWILDVENFKFEIVV